MTSPAKPPAYGLAAKRPRRQQPNGVDVVPGPANSERQLKGRAHACGSGSETETELHWGSQAVRRCRRSLLGAPSDLSEECHGLNGQRQQTDCYALRLTRNPVSVPVQVMGIGPPARRSSRPARRNRDPAAEVACTGCMKGRSSRPRTPPPGPALRRLALGQPALRRLALGQPALRRLAPRGRAGGRQPSPRTCSSAALRSARTSCTLAVAA